MEGYIALGLIVVFFIISLFINKVRRWRGMPYVSGLFMVFFILSAIVGDGPLYPNILFAFIAFGITIRSLQKIKNSENNENGS